MRLGKCLAGNVEHYLGPEVRFGASAGTVARDAGAREDLVAQRGPNPSVLCDEVKIEASRR